jgi:predicted nucleic acid-binding protein
MKIVLDANCVIDAVTSTSVAYSHMQKLLVAAAAGKIAVAISRHTLAEILEPLAARVLANSFEIVPYWPIGAVAELVATIEQLAGTWKDAGKNEEIQQELSRLAKSGNDIRDRGAYLDALHAGADVFVTSDNQLAGSGPAKRILDRFGLRVAKPYEIASEIN